MGRNVFVGIVAAGALSMLSVQGALATCYFKTPFVRPWNQCTVPDLTHSPDNLMACSGPTLVDPSATYSCHAVLNTTGPVRSCAHLRLRKNPPAGPVGNTRDIRIQVRIYDIYANGSPYTGSGFQLVVPIRVTDDHCVSTACTVVDTDVVVDLACTAGVCEAGYSPPTAAGYRGVDQILGLDLIQEGQEVEYGQLYILDPEGNRCLIQGQTTYKRESF